MFNFVKKIFSKNLDNNFSFNDAIKEKNGKSIHKEINIPKTIAHKTCDILVNDTTGQEIIGSISATDKYAISDDDSFCQAMNLYEGKDVNKDYKKAYRIFSRLAEQNNTKAKLIMIIMGTFGHGSDIKSYKINEVNEVVNSVKDSQFLYEMSQKLFNREFFDEDFKRAYEADSQMENEGFPYSMHVSNLETMISLFVKSLSNASANLGYIPAQKFITNRIRWIHL